MASGDESRRRPGSGPGHRSALERADGGSAGSLRASRDELSRIAEEQATLRQVATLVAYGVPPSEVFDAVASGLGRLLKVEFTTLARFEHDRMFTIVASWNAGDDPIAPPVGSRWSSEEESGAALVLRSGRPERLDYGDAVTGIAAWAWNQGIRSVVACPIRVNGRLWGVAAVLSSAPTPQPADTEERMLNFTELAAAAIANTESRAELAASRARVVAAADEARRRIERDLHDGVQQRLVSVGLELRMAEDELPHAYEKTKERLCRSMHGLTRITEDLREICCGLHPVILSRGGLVTALDALARRSAVPVALEIHDRRRLDERVEVAVYYVVSEALTNAAKHASASVVTVDLRIEDMTVQVLIRDDGVGGADFGRGSGLIGMRDRVEALGGSIHVTSAPGHGTSLLVAIPIEDT